MSIKSALVLLRVNNYIKNLLIFLPSFFSFSIVSSNNIEDLLFTFIFFSILNSSVYIFNDIADINLDKFHQKKKLRPIPSGLISLEASKKLALFLAIFSIIGFLIFFNFDIQILIIILLYVLLNYFYSYFFKNIKYIDILTVSFFYILRIYLGSYVAEVSLSIFFQLQVFFFSCFILSCKRMEIFYQYSKKKFLKKKYTLNSLKNLSYFFSILSVLNYFSYLFIDQKFTDSFSLYLSFLIYVMLILRYLNIISKKLIFDPIEIFYKDKIILLFLILYIFNFILGFNGLY